MSFKISINETLFIVSIKEIHINAKFKAQLDIFIKSGSQKEELFSGLNIEDCKIVFGSQKLKSYLEQIKNIKSSILCKNPKKLLFLFELRSKSYNAYAGEVEINFSSQNKTQYESKIQNCIDQKAKILYEVSTQNEQNEGVQNLSLNKKNSEKATIVSKKPLKQGEQNKLVKQDSIKQNSILKKITPTSVQSSRYKLNFKTQQKSSYLKTRTLPNSMNGSLNASNVEKEVSLINNSKQICEQQQHSQKETLAENNQRKKPNILTLKSASPDITKKIIELQKKLDEQKQRSLKIQIELQSKKCEIKQITKQAKSFQKKSQILQVELKKIKKIQATYVKQNNILKDSFQSLKQKLNQKSQQLTMLNKRNKSHQRTYKQELKNVYTKLQTVYKQKQFKNHEKVNLEQKFEQIQKKFHKQVEYKGQIFENQKQKFEKTMKKLQNEIQNTKQYFSKSVKLLGQQIQELLKNNKQNQHYNLKKNMVDFSMFQKSTNTQTYQLQDYDLNKQYLTDFRDILIKVERISTQLYSNVNQKRQEIHRNQKQIKDLKTQLRQLCMELKTAQQDMIKDKQKHKNQIQRFEELIEEEQKSSNKKIKQLKNQNKSLENQISDLNQTLSIKNRQISSLKIFKQQLEHNIKKISQQMVQKSQQFKHSIQVLLQQKDEMSRQFRAELVEIQSKLQKQRIKATQLVQKNSNLTKTVETIQKQNFVLNEKVLFQQKQLKMANETNQTMLKQANELKNMINEMTGFTQKKQKQMTSKNNQLAQQVNSFKQNFKSLQQAKNQIQSQLQKMKQQILYLKQQNSRKQQQLLKIQKIFNSKQKTSQSLKSSILDMKKQNDELKIKLKKKQSFEQQLQDQFQCNFYQIRQKLDFYINQNKQLQKLKSGFQRQINIKTKKLNIIIESLNYQLNIMTDYQNYVDNQNTKIIQSIIDLKKSLDSLDKQNINSNSKQILAIYINQIKQSTLKIDKIYDQVSNKYTQLQNVLAQPRKNISKNSISLKRVSTTDNLNKTLLKKNSSVANINADDSNTSRRMQKNNSMMVTFGQNRKKQQGKNQKSLNYQNILSLSSIDQALQKQRQNQNLQIKQTKSNRQQTDQPKKIGLKRLASKITPLRVRQGEQKAQSQSINSMRKGLRRMPTLK